MYRRPLAIGEGLPGCVAGRGFDRPPPSPRSLVPPIDLPGNDRVGDPRDTLNGTPFPVGSRDGRSWLARRALAAFRRFATSRLGEPSRLANCRPVSAMLAVPPDIQTARSARSRLAI